MYGLWEVLDLEFGLFGSFGSFGGKAGRYVSVGDDDMMILKEWERGMGNMRTMDSAGFGWVFIISLEGRMIWGWFLSLGERMGFRCGLSGFQMITKELSVSPSPLKFWTRILQLISNYCFKPSLS